MKRKIAGWILFAWGSVGLLGNAIFWLPNMAGDSELLLINCLFCIVFIALGGVLIKKGSKRKQDEASN